MKVTREGVFETNSSSMHSIHIARAAKTYDTIAPNGDGDIVLEGGEFGWEEETYYDSGTKANYCAVDTEGSAEKRTMLEKVIKDHTGAKGVIFKIKTDWNGGGYGNSYIDHQSDGTSHEAFESEEVLKEFIFNPKSHLRTDNDNH